MTAKWNEGLDENSSAYRFAADTSKTIRVVAGPGTGKSFALRRRVARLLEQGQDPKRILAVTFTRTAAQDLKKEIHEIGVDGADKVSARTLHSLCFSILHRESIIQNTGRYPRPLLDFEITPMLYDLDYSYGNINEKRKRLRAFESAWARLQSEDPGYPKDDIDRKFEKELKTWLITHKAMLFGEMIIETYHYLKDNPMCPEISEFDHVLVDEYQDLNKAEQAVIDLLASESFIAIIGDDDQSIYSFKYANPEGIREFPNTHPNCDGVDFDQCRRCPKQVVTMASRLISNNKNRTLGELYPFENNQNGNIHIIQWDTLEDEIEGVSKIIQNELFEKNVCPEDILILAPVRKIGLRIRDELVKRGVSAKSYFRDSALSNDILKNNFELFSLLANPDDMVSLRYLLGCGNPNYKKTSYKRLLDYSIQQEISIRETLERCIEGKIRIPNITTLINTYKSIKERIERLKEKCINCLDDFIEELAPSNEESDDFKNILLDAIEETGDINDIGFEDWIKGIYNYTVEKVSYPDSTDSSDHVRIMSLHSSKGLSAKYVVVMSAIDDLMPRIENGSDSKKQIEEQRRLFYVAITRCKGSKDNYPGTLIISSFISLSGSDALNFGISNSVPYQNKQVRSSRFIREFEDTAPISKRGKTLIKQIQ